jgi:hypothetical protein
VLKSISKKFFFLAVGYEHVGNSSDMDIAAKCPICGDSKKNKRLKRLHLYTKPGADVDFITCFNGDCPVSNKTIYSFLRDFYPSLLTQYKRENFGITMSKLANKTEDVFGEFKKENSNKSGKALNEVEKKLPVLIHDLTPFFKNIEVVPCAIKYLKGRGFTYDKNIFGEWYYGYQDLKIGDILYKITNSIVIPLYYKKKMYGFYSRNIINKQFYTYMHNSNIGFKIAFWFDINKNEPVYIYEGIFDAISGGLSNSIAVMGSRIPEERLKELKHPVFVLDNDKTGLFNSINYAKNGYDVFVQPSQYKEKDMNELMLNHPDVNISKMIKDNIFSSISAEVRLKSKL